MGKGEGEKSDRGVAYLTIGILCLEAIRLDDDRRECDYLWFILGGGVQQAIMTIWIDTEGALCMQIHFVLVMRKLWTEKEREGEEERITVCRQKLHISRVCARCDTHLI